MKHLIDIEDFEVFSRQSENNHASEIYMKYLQFMDIINKTPRSTLLQTGLIDSLDDSKSLAQLFANSLESNNQLFRKNTRSNEQLISLWLAKITSEAKNLFINKEVPIFKGIDKSLLREIAQLSPDKRVILDLPNYMLGMGILLIYQQSLPGMKLDGAAFTLASGNPVIGLSFRYPRLDYFWFTLLHELSHICLHFDKLQSPILDDFEDTDGQQQQDIEIEANMLAKNSFIDRASWRNCKPKYTNNEEDVIAFAEIMHIHPAIVAGMLRKEKGNYSLYTNIVNKTDVRSMVFDHD